MRLAFLTSVAALLAASAAAAAPNATPTLRVLPEPSLAVAGAGFAPHALVRLRVVEDGLERRVGVRTGSRGGFVVRFPTLERCDASAIGAVGPGGRRARVPTVWFVRECPPPPPLAP